MLVDVIREAKEEDGKVICIGLLQPARSRMFLLLAGFPPYLVHSRHSINICFMEEWLNGTTLPARGPAGPWWEQSWLSGGAPA